MLRQIGSGMAAKESNRCTLAPSSCGGQPTSGLGYGSAQADDDTSAARNAPATPPFTDIPIADSPDIAPRRIMA
ncbi:hypothetical protein QFZ27_002607 [Inquilinus ginsengisoli]|uniref:hypothetical protein n=1 Tax=Inquilinus ginsengisoli TaxID=363840 RepID=UPI003D242024